MKRTRFSVEQITGILKQAELGTPVQELCRIHGVSEQSFYRWKKIYGGMGASEARELKQLREENVKAWWRTCRLDKSMLQDVLRACRCVRLVRSMYYYCSHMDPIAGLAQRASPGQAIEYI